MAAADPDPTVWKWIASGAIGFATAMVGGFVTLYNKIVTRDQVQAMIDRDLIRMEKNQKEIFHKLDEQTRVLGEIQGRVEAISRGMTNHDR